MSRVNLHFIKRCRGHALNYIDHTSQNKLKELIVINGQNSREFTQPDKHTKVEALWCAPNSEHTPVLKQGEVLLHLNQPRRSQFPSRAISAV